VLVSDRNHFVYTPLLPSASVGSVELRSIVTPARELLVRLQRPRLWRWPLGASAAASPAPQWTFVNARVDDIDGATKEVHCTAVHSGAKFTISYDAAVVAVGSDHHDGGLPNVRQCCHFLRNAEDARSIRLAVNNALEAAAEPSTTAEERCRLLHFVVVGAGPAGCEIAAELHDFLKEDARRLFPRELLDNVQVTIVQSGATVLNSFQKRIAEYATEKFQRDGVRLLLNCRVVDVMPNELVVVDKHTQEKHTLLYGVCIWTTGIAMRPLVRRIAERIGTHVQSNHYALIVNHHLGVVGDTHRAMYAAGDCSTIRAADTRSRAAQLFQIADADGDGRIQLYEFLRFVRIIRDEHPQLVEFASILEPQFQEGRSSVSRSEFEAWLATVDAHCTALPPTAQVAFQQGQYLGRLLNERFRCWPANFDELDEGLYPPFEWRNLGAAAYIGGNVSVMELPILDPLHGQFVFWLWYGYSLLHQFSWRSRFLVMVDFIKTHIVGRDISKF
jgi:NADH:ubiquinone reductase (non-electrogenic)